MACFGQPFEYGTLLTIDAQGSALQPYNLPYEQVFEDRRVRITDLDDDGTQEVIVVVTHRDLGAALALYAFDAGNGHHLGIGLPHGPVWLHWRCQPLA